MTPREFEDSEDEFHHDNSKEHNPHASPPSPDSPVLEAAIETLSMHLKNKNLDAVLQARLTVMLGFLHLYTAKKNLGWQESTFLTAKAAGYGLGFSHSL